MYTWQKLFTIFYILLIEFYNLWKSDTTIKLENFIYEDKYKNLSTVQSYATEYKSRNTLNPKLFTGF